MGTPCGGDDVNQTLMLNMNFNLRSGPRAGCNGQRRRMDPNSIADWDRVALSTRFSMLSIRPVVELTSSARDHRDALGQGVFKSNEPWLLGDDPDSRSWHHPHIGTS